MRKTYEVTIFWGIAIQLYQLFCWVPIGYQGFWPFVRSQRYGTFAVLCLITPPVLSLLERIMGMQLLLLVCSAAYAAMVAWEPAEFIYWPSYWLAREPKWSECLNQWLLCRNSHPSVHLCICLFQIISTYLQRLNRLKYEVNNRANKSGFEIVFGFMFKFYHGTKPVCGHIRAGHI
jgi:hypothetical protein